MRDSRGDLSASREGLRVRLFDESLSNKMALAQRALNLLKAAESLEPLEVMLEGRPVKLNHLVGQGGSKKVFDLNDGFVIMLPNLSVDRPDATQWERMVVEEVEMAQKVIRSGLRAQSYEATVITVNGFPLSVIKAPSFSSMIVKGIQVRDRKRAPEEKIYLVNPFPPKGYKIKTIDTDIYIGSSDLFRSLENVRGPEYWRAIFTDLVDDVALLALHDFHFTSDTFNLVIEDTVESPNYFLDQRDLYRARAQRLHLYFYDFTTKQAARNGLVELKLINADGHVIVTNVENYVRDLELVLTDTILLAASNAECRAMMPDYPLMGASIKLGELSQQARAEVYPEFIAQVVAAVIRKVDELSMLERMARGGAVDLIHGQSPAKTLKKQ